MPLRRRVALAPTWAGRSCDRLPREQGRHGAAECISGAAEQLALDDGDSLVCTDAGDSRFEQIALQLEGHRVENRERFVQIGQAALAWIERLQARKLEVGEALFES